MNLGAQGTVCAGGRYDDLVEIQGGKPSPGIGFAMGVERILALLESIGMEQRQTPHVYLVSQVDEAEMLRLAESLRNDLPRLSLAVSLGGGSFKAQFKRADRSGAPFAVVLGPDELAAGTVQVKNLRAEGQRSACGAHRPVGRLVGRRIGRPGRRLIYHTSYSWIFPNNPSYGQDEQAWL